MKVLLTNDDGIQAGGLRALYKRLALEHQVTVIAPDRERSAVGHGITLSRPLRLTSADLDAEISGYAVSGTPADCIKLGVLEIFADKPDLVVSGINLGANTGININYSGTVSAAREAAIYGIPAIAVSVVGNGEDHFEEIAQFVANLSRMVFEQGLPSGTILNVNLPNVPVSETAGIRICRQGLSLFPETFIKRIDPRNREYYWHGMELPVAFEDHDTDGAALNGKYISITPLKCDMTDYLMIDELKTWGIEKDIHSN
ncbi:5'/3'-nucleotidase SurE [Thermodesulfobacteriota bacterium]